MMDACLNYSFFSRDHNNNIIGLDSNLGWHNESKGVMMINHYFKESIDYDAQLAKFGKELLEVDKDIDLGEDNNDEDLGQNYRIVSENKSGDWTKGSNRQTFLMEKQQLSFEVEYDSFE